MKMQEREYIEY